MSVIDIFTRKEVPLEEQPIVLTQEEQEILVEQAFAGNENVSDDDLVTIVNWAEATRISNLILDMLLKKQITVELDKDKIPIFSNKE